MIPLSGSSPRRSFIKQASPPRKEFSFHRHFLLFSQQKKNHRTLGAVVCWWTIRDSNPGPIGYEPTALTN